MTTETDLRDDGADGQADAQDNGTADASLDEDAEPVTDRVHDNSWSANLEKPQHAEDRSLVLDQAAVAVEHTAPGNHVNLVTHAAHGHPREYLFEHLDAMDGVGYEYVDQCGCGGHVTRVHVSA